MWFSRSKLVQRWYRSVYPSSVRQPFAAEDRIETIVWRSSLSATADRAPGLMPGPASQLVSNKNSTTGRARDVRWVGLGMHEWL